MGGIVQSDSQYTTLTVPQWNLMVHGVDINSLPVGSQLDVRVKTETLYATTMFPDGTIYASHTVIEASSDWSGVQTITKQTSSIFANTFFLFGIGALFAGVIIAVMIAIRRRHTKTSTYHDNSTQTNTNTESSSST